MIFHASIPAQEPKKVAAVLAELLQGKVTPFGARKGAFMAHSGHHRGHMIEVLPAAPEALATIAEPRRLYDAVHLALASELSADQVLAIGEREGWRTQRRRRGGSFDVIELWLEDHFMLEVLTPEMQAEYLAGFAGD